MFKLLVIEINFKIKFQFLHLRNANMFQPIDHVSSPLHLVLHPPVTHFVQCEWSENGFFTRQIKLDCLHSKSLAALFPIQNDEGVDGGDGQG